MAAVLAQGTSQISGLPFLDRGYENLETKLGLLGANVERLKAENRNACSLANDHLFATHSKR